MRCKVTRVDVGYAARFSANIKSYFKGRDKKRRLYIYIGRRNNINKNRERERE